ncbi:hypothetical protein Taro_032777 [Colocasia esculenta]|uniref:Uncharacterized protein n=1 Tax=Colocasia esculenta TaxID=4460 RepID=A0A843WAF2_COLES|nr:hypothetical protein [Colocasia esculenta]
MLVHRLSYPLDKTQIFVRAVIGTARETPIRNRHFDPSAPGRMRRFSLRRPNSSPEAWSRAADAITYGHPFAQTNITFRSVIGIAYKTQIWNRHSETHVAHFLPQVIRHHFGVEKPPFHSLKMRFQPSISSFPSNVSLDYANPWWGNHTKSDCHDDRKLCLTRRENSYPGRRYGCTNIVDIVTPSVLFPPLR